MILAPEDAFRMRFFRKSGATYVFGEHEDVGLISSGPPDNYSWEIVKEKIKIDNRGHDYF